MKRHKCRKFSSVQQNVEEKEYHLSCNFIESLEDSGSEALPDVFDGSGLGDGGISASVGLRGESSGEGGLEVHKELIFVHRLL